MTVHHMIRPFNQIPCSGISRLRHSITAGNLHTDKLGALIIILLQKRQLFQTLFYGRRKRIRLSVSDNQKFISPNPVIGSLPAAGFPNQTCRVHNTAIPCFMPKGIIIIFQVI